MKILHKPDHTTWTYEFTCSTCKATLKADYTDLKYRTEKQWYSGRDIDDGYETDVDWYYLTCPVCGGDRSSRFAHEFGIPYLLQEKIKKDYNESAQKGRHK